MHSISKNLKNIRKKRGWTQQQMADCLFVTRQTISNWENGKTLPDLETIEQVSEKLDVDSRYLLYGRLTEEKYRKLNGLTITIILLILVFLFVVFEKISFVILDRISEYAGYTILQLYTPYSNLIWWWTMLFSPLWVMLLLFNWAMADNNSLPSKILRISTNVFLFTLAILSCYSSVCSCIYTYERYNNVVVTAHQRFEMAEYNYGIGTYVPYDFGWRGGNVDQIFYIDNDDAETDEYIEYLINSQALKIYRIAFESGRAKHEMWRYGIETAPAVLIINNGNVEVLEGYDEISLKLENKIHNYKMHNIFFY